VQPQHYNKDGNKMRTVRTKVYQFSELSEQAKQKAIEVCADYNVSYDWWQFTYEDAANIGLKITGFDIDRGSYCNGEFTLSAHEVAANIIRDHGELCETYKTAQSFLDTVNDIQGKYEELEGAEYEDEMIEAEDEFLKFLLEDYRIILKNEYEYQTSEEAILETIQANEYEFKADGTRF